MNWKILTGVIAGALAIFVFAIYYQIVIGAWMVSTQQQTMELYAGSKEKCYFIKYSTGTVSEPMVKYNREGKGLHRTALLKEHGYKEICGIGIEMTLGTTTSSNAYASGSYVRSEYLPLLAIFGK